MVTIIADNYYGYCKKEVKTQISFAANLYGCAKRNTPAAPSPFPTYVLGQEFRAKQRRQPEKGPFRRCHAPARTEWLTSSPKAMPSIATIRISCTFRKTAELNVREGFIQLDGCGQAATQLALRAEATYVLAERLPHPHGKAIRRLRRGGWWARDLAARSATSPAPSPAAANPKSRSRSAMCMLEGPVFVGDYHRDVEQVAEILKKDFSGIYKKRLPTRRTSRPILSPERTMGSVIQLFTPSRRIQG